MADVDDQIVVITVDRAVVQSELKVAITLLGDGVLRRAVDGLVVAGLPEGNGRTFCNEDGVITAVFRELSGAD